MPLVSNISLTSLLKKILFLGLIVLLAFSPLVPFFEVPTAQAAVVQKCVTTVIGGMGTVTTTDPNADGTCPNGGLLRSIESADISPQGTITPKNSGGTSGIGATIGFWLAQIIYVFTVGLGSGFAFLGAMFLNFAVHISLDSAAYGLDFVSLGWTMLRDLANMAFIFILIYIALKVMFEAHTAGTMGMLAKVLAVALVINFSFFATRVVIDAGNLISVQFYNAVVSTTPNANLTLINTTAGAVSLPLEVPDITKNIMAGVNFQSALGPDSFKNISGDGGDLGDLGATFIAYSFIYIVLGIMLCLLAAAFVAAGVKFIVRIVMLWFSIITAPLALVAWSFQGGGGHGGGHGGGSYFQKWRTNLISHAFYPAVFLFVLLLISNFMSVTGAGGLGGGLVQDAIAGVGTQTGFAAVAIALANIAVRLGFVIVMLYLALKAGDYFEVFGAGVAKAWGNNFAFGGTGWVLRNTLGRGSRFLDNTLNKNAEGHTRSKAVAALLNIPAKRSFDVRQPLSKIPVLKDQLEKDFGKPSGKGGWDEFVHHKAAEDKKKADALAKATTDHADPKAEQKAQEKFRQQYGAANFDSRVNELTHAIEGFRKEEIELQKNILKATDEAAREKYQSDLKKKQNDIKNTEKQLKALKGMGQRIIEAQNKTHAQEVAIKLMSSNNVVKYMAGKKILMGKSSTEKFKEAAKEAAKEDEDEKSTGDHNEAPKNGPGGNPHGPSTGTIDGHANDNHH